MEPYICNAEAAEQIHDWLLHRGGIYIWKSVNLSNPGASWTSPALDKDCKAVTKPNWQCDNAPSRHITDIAEVSVATAKEVKRFHVATRMSGNGMAIKVTDAGTRRIRAEVDKASHKYGKTAWYTFDYQSHDNAVIMIDDQTVPMSEWVKVRDQELAA